MKILVTGVAGFIGFHVAARLIERGDTVVGIDNLNDYYDVRLKQARLEKLLGRPGFEFVKIDVSNRVQMEELFGTHSFDMVVHMAAQAGVRYSLENPHAYVQANLVGFINILEGCRKQWCEEMSCVVRCASCEEGVIRNTQYARHLVYASSSSVYGLNSKMPFSVSENVDHPISLYAATKKANELMAHTYSHLYGIPTTGLRFFTVYGPWGRPDMALFKFTKAILDGASIDVYNNGKMKRDFTYIDDIVEGVIRTMDKIPAAYKIYNIGNNSPVQLLDFIKVIENATGKKAKINFLPMQPGDVPETCANVDDLSRDVGFSPSTDIRDGIKNFVEWYCDYYGRA